MGIDLGQIQHDLDDVANRLARDFAEEAARRMIDSVDTPYPPASRPGHPPHKRSGQLQNSIEVVPRSDGQWDVEVTAPHAGYLEDGTSRMEARPFIGPAWESMADYEPKANTEV